MSLHDEYARVTPYEIAFPDDGLLENLASDVQTEAAGRGVDAQLPAVFMTLDAVGEIVQEMRSPDAPSEAAHQLAALLFHGMHFARAERPFYLLGTAAARHLVEGAPVGEPRPPAEAGYLQLPQHLFWVDGPGGGAPESVDGFFWFASDAGMLHVLSVTGLLPERMAFRAVPLPEAPLADAREWLTAEVRGGGHDYESSLPGHDLDRLYSVETAGEVLKLLARFFAYVVAVPKAGAAADSPARAEESGPDPSRLPCTRIQLVA